MHYSKSKKNKIPILKLEQTIDFLKLDSKLFGYKVAKILKPRLATAQLRLILNYLRQQNVCLVYWPSDNADRQSQIAAKKLHGFLSSEQITYLINLKKKNLRLPPIAADIKTYQAATPTPELKQLAIQAGNYSRFNLDPKISKKLFHKLYNTWIKNSANKKIADKIIIIKNRKKIIAMTTLGTKNKRGDIGLLAVNENFRGKKLGTKLVFAAQNYFKQQGFSQAQVVTQKANILACRLYEKCGFRQEKIENFYHFWLD